MVHFGVEFDVFYSFQALIVISQQDVQAQEAYKAEIA